MESSCACGIDLSGFISHGISYLFSRLIGKLMRRWEGDIRVDIKGIDAIMLIWMDSAHDKGLLNGSCKYLIWPPGSIKPWDLFSDL